MDQPGTPSGSWARLWDIFHQALDRDAAARPAFLDKSCGADEVLRREVDELLAAHDSSSCLDHSPIPPDIAASGLITSVGDSDPLAPGDVLAGRFEIVRRIGQGGMGTTYEALDRQLGAAIALKTLDPKTAGNPVAIERFRREIALGRLVTHRNVCRIFDLVESTQEGAPSPIVFLTMELLAGETLAERLRRDGPLPLDEALVIAQQVGAALEAAHRVEVIHRDLKPSNVMLVRENGGLRAVVTDFGIAKLRTASGDPAAALTGSGQTLGTPEYMAPEQLEGYEATPLTDVYAFGLLLYEMTTGGPPFDVDTPLAAAARRLTHRVPSPRLRRHDLTTTWERTVLTCLARDPRERFQSAAAAYEALGGWLQARLSHRTRINAGLVAAVALLLLILGVEARSWIGQRLTRSATSLGPALQLAQRDFVLVAEFDNRTGELIFDGTVRHALERELNNSHFVSVVPRERVIDAFRLMQRPLDTVLEGDVAREVCLRDGKIRALVRGRIERIGDTYVMSAELVDPQKGRVVSSLSEEAREQSQVLAAVRRLSNRLREIVGEALPEINRTEQTLAQVTTPSLRALQLYTQADAIIARGAGNAAAEALLRQAVEEDPQFASAYIHLAHAIRNQGRPATDFLPYAERAFGLADTTTERERYFIRGSYYDLSNDAQQAIANYQAELQLYPDHFWATNNLSPLLLLNRPEAAVPFRLRMAELRPNDFLASYRAAWAVSVVDNNPQAAQVPLERTRLLITSDIQQRYSDQTAWVESWPVHLHWFEGDASGALEELRRLESRVEPHFDPELQIEIAVAHRALGRLRDADRHSSASAEALLYNAFVRNDLAAVRRHADALPPGNNVQAATLMARAGLIAEAKSRLRSIAIQDHPLARLDIAYGEIALRERRTGVAVELLQKGLRLEQPFKTPYYFIGAEALAEARLARHEVDEAVGALEEVIPLKGAAFDRAGAFWLHAAWELAKLYRSVGRVEDAVRVEAELRSRLTYADPDHPIVVGLQHLRGTTTP